LSGCCISGSLTTPWHLPGASPYQERCPNGVIF
jgi:hypothetical protein